MASLGAASGVISLAIMNNLREVNGCSRGILGCPAPQ